jgi:hypothetical protein
MLLCRKYASFVQADAAELREVTADILERVTRTELNQAVNAQVRPLVTAITAMEKAIHVQEINVNSARMQIQQQLTVPTTREGPPR